MVHVRVEGLDEGVHLLSQWIAEYKDLDLLESCSLEKNDANKRCFMDCLALLNMQ